MSARIVASLTLALALSTAAFARSRPIVPREEGWFQVERSATAGGYEVIYYPPGHAVNVALRYPGAPEPSHMRPSWKPRTYSWIAVVTVHPDEIRYATSITSYVGTFRTEKAAKAYCDEHGRVHIECRVHPLSRPVK